MRERKVDTSGTKGVGGGMEESVIWDLEWRARVWEDCLVFGKEGRRYGMGAWVRVREGRRKEGRERGLGCRVIMMAESESEQPGAVSDLLLSLNVPEAAIRNKQLVLLPASARHCTFRW